MPGPLRAGQASGPEAGLGRPAARRQEIDIVSIVAPITKYAVTVDGPARRSATTSRRRSTWPRPAGRGPVWLDIPLDVQGAQIEPADARVATTPRCEDLADGDRGPDSESGRRDDRRCSTPPSGRSCSSATACGWPAPATTCSAWSTPRHPGADDLDGRRSAVGDAPAVLRQARARWRPAARTSPSRTPTCCSSIGARLDVAGHRVRSIAVRARGAEGHGRHRPGRDQEARLARRPPGHAPTPATFIAGLLEQRPDRCRRWTVRDWLAPMCRTGRRDIRSSCPSTGSVRTRQHLRLLERALRRARRRRPDRPWQLGRGIETFWLSFAVKEGQRLFSTGGSGAMGFGLPGEHRRLPRQRSEADDLRRRRRRLPDEHPGARDRRATRAADQVLRHQQRRLRVDPGVAEQLLPRASRRLRRHERPDPAGPLKVGAAYGLATARITDNAGLGRQIRDVLDRPGPVVCEVIVAPDRRSARAYRRCSGRTAHGQSEPLEDLWPFLDRDEFRANMLIPTIDDWPRRAPT